MRELGAEDSGLITDGSLSRYLMHAPRNDDGGDEEQRVRRDIRLGWPLFALVSDLAARRDVRSLKLLYSGSTPLHAILADDVEYRGDAGFARRAGAPFRETEPAAVHAARALAGLGLALASDEPRMEPLRSALAWYADARGALAAHRWDPRDVNWDQPGMRRLGPLLAAAAGDERLAGAALTAAVSLHALESPGIKRRQRSSVTVLLVKGTEGVRARLLLSVASGLPPGLVPDPQRMALFTGDSAFQQSLARAWSQVRTRRVGGTVLWSIEDEQGPSPRITGESAGAALAVALDETRRLSRALPWLRVARRLQGSTAVVGRVDDLGYLQGVEGYTGKLAALSKNSRVIVPAADTEKATRAAAQELEIVPATRWAEAARKARRLSGMVVLRQVLAGTLGLALLAGSLLAAYYNHGEDKLQLQKISAQLSRTADDLQSTDPSLAAQLAVAANNADSTSNSQTQLLSAAAGPLSSKLTGPVGAVDSVAFSPDGKILAAGAKDDKIWLWNLADQARPVLLGPPLTGPKAEIDSLAFSPDGATLAASSGNAVWRWRFAGPAHRGAPAPLAPLPGPGRPFGTVTFSPDGNTLIAADSDNTIWRWNIADQARPVRLGAPLTGPAGTIFSVAVSPVGDILAAASGDGRIWAWRMTDPAAPVFLGSTADGPAAGGLYSAAFGPSGKILAAGSYDGEVWLWDVSDPAHPARLGVPLKGPASIVDSVAFSPDGTRLAATSGADKVWLWNVTDPGQPTQLGLPLTSPEPVVSQAVFSPRSSTTVATAGADGTVRLWSLPGSVLIGPGGSVNSVALGAHGKVVAASDTRSTVWLWDLADPRRPGVVLAVPGGSVDALAISPDGQLLAATGNYGVVWLWDITDPGKPVGLPPMILPGATVHSVAFSPDSRTLAVGGGSGRTGEVWLWDVSHPVHPARIGPPLPGPFLAVLTITFSRTGNMLAFAGAARTIYLWNVTTPALPVRLSTMDSPPSAFNVSSVALSPDGQLLAAGTRTTVSLWRLTDPRHPAPLAPLSGPTNAVSSVAFAPSGTMLAAGSWDAKVWLWSLSGSAPPALLGRPLTGQAAVINSVAFAPGSGVLAAGGNGGITQLWNLDVDAAVTRICGMTADALTPTQWSQDVNGVPYTPPCVHPARTGLLHPS